LYKVNTPTKYSEKQANVLSYINLSPINLLYIFILWLLSGIFNWSY